MFRKSVVCFGALAVALLLTGTLAAQEWPAYRGDPLQRGPGDYLAWYKILCCALVFIFWVRTTDWINRDSLEIDDPLFRGRLPRSAGGIHRTTGNVHPDAECAGDGRTKGDDAVAYQGLVQGHRLGQETQEEGNRLTA